VRSPGESVAGLGHECVLAGQVGFRFCDGWEDVFFEAEGIFCDPGLGLWVVRFEQLNDEVSQVSSNALKTVKLTESVLSRLSE